MLRKILFSVLLLSSFAFVSQEYRATVTQSALESPVVASVALATESSTDFSPLSVTGPTTASTMLFHQPRQEANRLVSQQRGVHHLPVQRGGNPLLDIYRRRPTLFLDQSLDRARAALTVEPAVQVAVSWVEDLLTMLPTNPLAAGGVYTFTHLPTNHSRQDAPLAAPYPGRYTDERHEGTLFPDRDSLP